MDKKAVEQLIRKAYSESEANNQHFAQVRTIVESLPKRYYDLVCRRVIQKKRWLQLEDELHYSERRMRTLLTEALELLNRRITEVHSGGI